MEVQLCENRPVYEDPFRAQKVQRGPAQRGDGPHRSESEADGMSQSARGRRRLLWFEDGMDLRDTQQAAAFSQGPSRHCARRTVGQLLIHHHTETAGAGELHHRRNTPRLGDGGVVFLRLFPIDLQGCRALTPESTGHGLGGEMLLVRPSSVAPLPDEDPRCSQPSSRRRRTWQKVA